MSGSRAASQLSVSKDTTSRFCHNLPKKGLISQVHRYRIGRGLQFSAFDMIRYPSLISQTQ